MSIRIIPTNSIRTILAYWLKCTCCCQSRVRGSKKHATLRMPPPRGSAESRRVGHGFSQARGIGAGHERHSGERRRREVGEEQKASSEEPRARGTSGPVLVVLLSKREPSQRLALSQ